MAIIRIDDDGFMRPLHEITHAFVREQSGGEWTEEIITKDAQKLEELIRKIIHLSTPYAEGKNLFVIYDR